MQPPVQGSTASGSGFSTQPDGEALQQANADLQQDYMRLHAQTMESCKQLAHANATAQEAMQQKADAANAEAQVHLAYQQAQLERAQLEAMRLQMENAYQFQATQQQASQNQPIQSLTESSSS